jgi:hypothetical protein
MFATTIKVVSPEKTERSGVVEIQIDPLFNSILGAPGRNYLHKLASDYFVGRYRVDIKVIAVEPLVSRYDSLAQSFELLELFSTPKTCPKCNGKPKEAGHSGRHTVAK